MLQKEKRVISTGLLFILIIFLSVVMQVSHASAAKNPIYVIKKGSTKKVTTVLNTIKKSSKKYRNLKWKTKNKKVVFIKKGSKIKGRKKGYTYIRGYRNGKKIISIKIIVGTPIKSISTKQSVIPLYYNTKMKINATIKPKAATLKKLKYSSKNKKIVKVSGNGIISAVNYGKTKIIILSEDSRKKTTITVTVKPELIRDTTFGKVKGVHTKSSLVWYGIPYGKSTEGNNRWREPKDPNKWTKTLDCISKKANAVQAANGLTTYSGTEDCLYVNIYRPDHAKTNLPVMVFMHGGGNANGTANKDFTLMANECNTIIVSVSFRLGAFGFLSHPALQNGTPEENSGNFTLLDIKKSLKWVQNNIVHFGGNKNNVTLTGFSAGARNTLFCMISPIMKGLFHKVISFSGGMETFPPSKGEESVNKKLAKILVNRGAFSTNAKALSYIEELKLEEIRELLENLTTLEVANMYRSPSLILSEFPQGFADGVVLPSEGFSVIENGKYNRVPAILGSNRMEFASFSYTTGLELTKTDKSTITSSDEMLALVRESVKYGSQLQANHYVEKPAERILSDPMHKSVYGYRLVWGSNPAITGNFFSEYVGSRHGNDLDFLCMTYSDLASPLAPNAISDSNLAGRQRLSEQMQAYIRNFLKKGDPNDPSLGLWNTWSNGVDDGRIMMFDANQNYAISYMSTEYLKADEIFKNMKETLNEKWYNLLAFSNFAGRFFMPETVPLYNDRE